MIKNRILSLQENLNHNEAFWITSGSNRFYLTGFNSSAGSVLITKSSAVFFIDFRYFEKAKYTVDSCEVMLYDRGHKGIYEYCKQKNIKEIFIESSQTSLTQHKYLSELFDGINISKENKLDIKLAEMRAVKSEYELRFIKQAQSLTEHTLDYILPRIAVGRTEREVMLDMEFFMRGLGADGVSFDFIVVSGKNSSLPHGVPTDKKIEKGDFVTMDFGAIVKGYCSDMTRTVAVGSVTDEQRLVYDTTLKAQLAAIDAIKAGAVCVDIDKIARDIIYDAGYKGCFGHALGHSIGVDVHESPNLSPNNKAILEIGNVVTVEPGIYLENKFGVRIEDMVYVTENGCINLTNSNKNLIIL